MTTTDDDNDGDFSQLIKALQPSSAEFP